MPRVRIDAPAPDFELPDFTGSLFHLRDFRGKANVLLVFNRGFTWPFCRAHMAQLRQDHQKLQRTGTVVAVLGPEDRTAFASFWQKNRLPFVGVPDPKHSVLKLYGQEIKLFRFGRMPAQVLIDRQGIARFVYYGHDMTDIPTTAEVLGAIASLEHQVEPDL